MLFSSDVSAVEDRHAPRMRGEEHRGLAGRVPRSDDLDVETVRVRSLAACGTVEDPLAHEAIEALDLELPPRDAAGEDDRPGPQDVAAVEVHLVRLRRIDACDDRVTRISAPSRRACAALASRGRRPRRPRGSRGSSRSVTTCPPARRAPRARRRACGAPRRHRTPPRRGRPARRRRRPCRTRRRAARSRSRAARRPAATAAARRSSRSTMRNAGQSPSAGSAPPHSSASAGTSGWNQRNRIWLRSRKRRRSAHAASQRWPSTIARYGVGDDASAWSPFGPPIRSAASRPTCVATSGTLAASAW